MNTQIERPVYPQHWLPPKYVTRVTLIQTGGQSDRHPATLGAIYRDRRRSPSTQYTAECWSCIRVDHNCVGWLSIPTDVGNAERLFWRHRQTHHLGR